MDTLTIDTGLVIDFGPGNSPGNSPGDSTALRITDTLDFECELNQLAKETAAGGGDHFEFLDAAIAAIKANYEVELSRGQVDALKDALALHNAKKKASAVGAIAETWNSAASTASRRSD